MIGVEPARDLAEGLSGGVPLTDTSDDFGRDRRPATGTHDSSARRFRFSPALGEVALELCSRDQPRTPFRLHGWYRGDDATVERCEADTERLGGLLARVGEPRDALGKLKLGGRLRPCDLPRVALLPFVLASQPSVHYPYIVQQL